MHPLASPPGGESGCCIEGRAFLSSASAGGWKVWNVGGSEVLKKESFLSFDYCTCLLFPGCRKYWKILVEQHVDCTNVSLYGFCLI